MSNRISQDAISALVDTLANIEHERWSHWQRYMHGKCERRPDGSLTIPSELVSQWERQSTTPYSELTDTEKESDREQVRRYLPVVLEAFQIEPDYVGK